MSIVIFVFFSGCAKELVEDKEVKQQSFEVCNPENCNVKCVGFDFYYGGSCVDSKCSYKYVEKNSNKCGAPFVEVDKYKVEKKYDFYSKLLLCDYDPAFKKYTLVFEIRNKTDNIPKIGSRVWLKVPAFNYGTYKTIFKEYAKNKVLWGDNFYTYEGVRYNGQSWDIRNVEVPSDLDFELIYCESGSYDFESCTKDSGVLIFEGNTKDLCAN
ncbi:MAG: hypothetical protein QXT97_00410 [Candidatus Diapherotrites archaeon]